MKYARYILLMLLTMTLFVVMVGCEDDAQDDVNTAITGSWRMASVVIKDTPIGDLTMTADAFLGSSETGALTSTMTFNEDGTAYVTTTYENDPDDVVQGTWEKDGDLLVIVGAGIDDTVGYMLDDTELTLTVTMPIDFEGDGTAEDTEIDMTYTLL